MYFALARVQYRYITLLMVVISGMWGRSFNKSSNGLIAMLQTIQGTYHNGKIELSEPPQGIVESQVFVTFLTPQTTIATHHLMSFGMFSGAEQSTEIDFQSAEFQGDIDDELDWT